MTAEVEEPFPHAMLPGEIARARRELEQLQDEADAERAVLERLRADVAVGLRLLESSRSVYLLDEKERLIVALLRAHTEFERTALKSEEISRASGLDADAEPPDRTPYDARVDQALIDASQRETDLALPLSAGSPEALKR